MIITDTGKVKAEADFPPSPRHAHPPGQGTLDFSKARYYLKEDYEREVRDDF